MATLFIRERKTGKGESRWGVHYRDGGRGSQKYGGTFKTLQEAEHRKALIGAQLASGAPVRFSNLPEPIAHRWIYFVRMGLEGPIKIGNAVDVDRRVRHMQTANPYPLALMAKIPWFEGEEERLQLAFRHAQLMGEWFRPTPELLAYIRQQADELHPDAMSYQKARLYQKVRHA